MKSRPRVSVDTALETRRVLVVAGPGGVGKTTTAAALALQAAIAGRRVLVCTIDPSRRLATSLGLERLADRPRRLGIERVAPTARGELWAMTLDTQRTFDALVQRHAPNASARERILGNRFYQQISAALAGSHEYMAMEKLLELSREERFDLVVLDTPPTRHALDFLEAPERLMGFLDTSVLRWFLKPYFVAGRLTLKVATRGGALALRLADRVLGLRFLEDLSEFFLAFDGMYDGFKARAAEVQALLRGPVSGFVVVAGPSRALLEATFLWKRLQEGGMPLVSFVVNRTHPFTKPTRRERVKVRLDESLAFKLLETFKEQQTLARNEARLLDGLKEEIGHPVVLVPEMEADIHDLRGLKQVGEALLAAAGAEPRRLA